MILTIGRTQVGLRGPLPSPNLMSLDGTRCPITPKQRQWMRRRAEKRDRIQHLLDTSIYQVEKVRPILPLSVDHE